jgi:RHS repeat-associated protein
MNVFGNYIDELLYRRGTVPVSRRFYVHDHLYSPVASITTAGNISERYEYDAYGKCTIWDSGWTTERPEPADTPVFPHPNPYLFTGRRIDYLDGGDLPLMHYRNRSYDTYTGRFLQHDPLGTNPSSFFLNPFVPFFQYVDGMNLYQYVINNPIVSFDPYGLANGCGPEGGPDVPDDPWWIGGGNFEPACNNHDDCYGNCSRTKEDCDKRFRKDLRKACRKRYWWNPNLMMHCYGIAEIYVKAVQWWGDDAYNKAQEHCPTGCKNGGIEPPPGLVPGYW